MAMYIDGFAFPIPKAHLDEYKEVVDKVAEIWKEYGATGYYLIEISSSNGKNAVLKVLKK